VGGGGEVVSVVTTTTTAMIQIVSTTPPPVYVQRGKCIPCASKPEAAKWSSVPAGECKFECKNGTKRVDDKCLPCENEAPKGNFTWRSKCTWSCLHGFRLITKIPPVCAKCEMNLTNNSRWIPDIDEYSRASCPWECLPGYVLEGGVCTPCKGGKDFNSHWTKGCRWECDAGWKRSDLGCSVCKTDKEANSGWSNTTGCEWKCRAGYGMVDGKCKKCSEDLDPYAHWNVDNTARLCTWECNTGYFLLKTSEFRISLPVAIAIGMRSCP
jgi:hypothetical protein